MNFSWDKKMATRTFSRSTDSMGWLPPQPVAHRSHSTHSLGEPEDQYNAVEGWFTYGARFQQKQLAEREQKMVALLQERQARALDRVRASPTQVTSHVTSQTTHAQGKVRQMFEERRHQQQQHGGGAGAGGSTRTGVDRGYPLRPIRHESNKITEYETPTKTQDVNHNSLHHQHNMIIERLNNIHLKDTDELDNMNNIEDETFPESLCASPTIRLVPPVLAPIHNRSQQHSKTKPVPPKAMAPTPKVTRKAPQKINISNVNKSSDDDLIIPKEQNRTRETLHGRSKTNILGHRKNVKDFVKEQTKSKKEQEISDDDIKDREEDDLLNNRILEQEKQLHENITRNGHYVNPVHQKVEENWSNRNQVGGKGKQMSYDNVWGTEDAKSRPTKNQDTTITSSGTPHSPIKVAPSKSRPQAAAVRTTPPKSLGKTAMSTPRQAKKSGVSSASAGVACVVCGRTFAPDRVERHQNICKKTSTKKRKPYDTLKHRVTGTEAEPFLRQLRKEQTAHKPPAKTGVKAVSSGETTKTGTGASGGSAKPLNSTWRQKHEDFIRSIRAAKKVQAHVAAGGSIKDLPPPPPSENPDYVQCPHCQRRFNKAAAERHIPKCADFQFNKPKPQARNTPKPGPKRPARR